MKLIKLINTESEFNWDSLTINEKVIVGCETELRVQNAYTDKHNAKLDLAVHLKGIGVIKGGAGKKVKAGMPEMKALQKSIVADYVKHSGDIKLDSAQKAVRKFFTDAGFRVRDEKVGTPPPKGGKRVTALFNKDKTVVVIDGRTYVYVKVK